VRELPALVRDQLRIFAVGRLVISHLNGRFNVGIQAGEFFDNRSAVLIPFGLFRNGKSIAPESILVLATVLKNCSQQAPLRFAIPYI
jgi:hypothetical protein